VGSSVLAAALGLGLGYLGYAQGLGAGVASADGRFGALRRASSSALGFDALYRALFVRPGEGLAEGFREVDEEVLEKGIGGSEAGVSEVGQSVVQVQSGFVRVYALLMLVGLAALVLVVAFTRAGA